MPKIEDAIALPRRFYKQTSLTESEGGFGVALDARALRTPGGAVFVAPTRALAQLCAGEWAAQGEHIAPATMPVSQIAFASIDLTPRNRSQLIDYVVSFAQTDLCCHRAESPIELSVRQSTLWDPLVAWGATDLAAALPVVVGVIAAKVDDAALSALSGHAAVLDDFRLTALAQTAGLAGSALIAFALLRGRITPDAAFQAAALDNLWSLERWGEDEEARQRLDRQRVEYGALGRFLAALDP
ncbi:MAG: ATP12 family chaperone protein [Hyphomonadaceae bacterium]